MERGFSEPSAQSLLRITPRPSNVLGLQEHRGSLGSLRGLKISAITDWHCKEDKADDTLDAVPSGSRLKGERSVTDLGAGLSWKPPQFSSIPPLSLQGL